MQDEPARRDPFAGLPSWADDPFGSEWEPRFRVSMPSTDIYTVKDSEMIAEVHLPAFDVGEIAVDVDGRDLVIRGDRHQKAEKDGRNYVLRETSQSFYRRITLPARADQSKVTAAFEDGILRVTIPYDGITHVKRIPITT